MAPNETNRIEMRHWFIIKDVAAYCLVSEVTVRRWIKSGKLSAIRLPSGLYRISLADFRDFLERYQVYVKHA